MDIQPNPIAPKLTSQEKTKGLYGFEIREFDKRCTDRATKWDIKRLWQRSHEIIRLALTGMSQVDIAKVLNICPGSVSNTLNSPIAQEKLSKMRKELDTNTINVSLEVSRLAEKAIATYDEILDNETVSLKLKKETADTILMDLGGHRSPTKIDSRQFSMTATLEEIEEFKQRGIKAAKASGMIVEVPNESVPNE